MALKSHIVGMTPNRRHMTSYLLAKLFVFTQKTSHPRAQRDVRSIPTPDFFSVTHLATLLDFRV